MITLDNFSATTSGTTRTTTAGSATIGEATAGFYNGFNTRVSGGSTNQLNQTRSAKTLSAGVFNSGSGTVLLSSDGAGSALITNFAAYFYYYNDNSSPVNFTNPGGIYDGFQIKTGAVSTNNAFMSAYVSVETGTSFFTYTLPSTAMWSANTTYNIPFSAFPGVDFTQLTSFSVGIGRVDSSGNPISVAGNVPFSSSAEFTEISVVPEPTHMVSVAGIGAAYGAWRLRKLRRSRTAAGDAIAG